MGIEEEFAHVVEESCTSSHGFAGVSTITKFLEEKAQKSNIREACLKHVLYQEPVTWESVKERVWNTDEERDSNCFQFLQGDVVFTSLVIVPGVAETSISQTKWMILAPDCDAVRGDFVRVAPLFETSDIYSTSLKMKSQKYFPVIFEHERLAADLTTPCYIQKQYKAAAIVRATLTVNGWHLLNAFLQNRETRANVDEAIRVRTPL